MSAAGMDRVALAAEDLALREEVAALEKRRSAIQARRSEIVGALRVNASLNADALAIAASVLTLKGKFQHGEQMGVVRDAKDEILKAGGKLRHEYFGTKNYDRFVGQRSDHSYGCGPSHGSIVFAVGLTMEARKRWLERHEIEAAIYALDCFAQGLLDGEQLEAIAREGRKVAS